MYEEDGGDASEGVAGEFDGEVLAEVLAEAGHQSLGELRQPVVLGGVHHVLVLVLLRAPCRRGRQRGQAAADDQPLRLLRLLAVAKRKRKPKKKRKEKERTDGQHSARDTRGGG
jgi:hypothetical protein